MAEKPQPSLHLQQAIRPTRPRLRPDPDPSISSSVPTLQFPTPQGSRVLANWISSSSPNIMRSSSVSDSDSLAGSSYDFISSADDESQDGHLNEYMTDSLEILPNQDDVHSMAGVVVDADSESDDDQADHRSNTDSIRYAEDVLEHPSTSSPSHSESGSVLESSTPLVQSIEFMEGDSTVCLDMTSVKHTIRDFTEDETAIIAKEMDIKNPPKRMAATIRQTMSLHYLPIHEPLRILYAGSEAGKRDIVNKVSTALLASGLTDSTGSDGVYNVMPISSFGSSKVPEIDEIQLVEVSPCYVQVDRCTSAEELYEAGSFHNDTVYSITLANDKTYMSLFSPSGSLVSPKWTLPHIAIFYITANDDEKQEATRKAAWEFMTRHDVPSIFISHAQSFGNSPLGDRWRDLVDDAAVHLCLESRDPDRQIIPERFPIDFASFLNIDARQMNRNLAYLTGLGEPLDVSDNTEDLSAQTSRDLLTRFLPGLPDEVQDIVKNFQQSANWKHVLVALLSSLFWAYLTLMLVPNFFANRHEKLLSSTTAVSIVTPSATCLVPTVTPTVTINLTSTKTINLGIAEPTNLAAQFGGFLSDKAQAVVTESDARKASCSIEVYSPNEILVKVPAGTKSIWLAKGAIDIDVWRGKEMLKSKLSSTDDGILIEINKKDAYGVMNVSVVTTRKPKINETVAVNFGKPAIVEAFEAGASFLQITAKKFVGVADEAVRIVEAKYHSAASLLEYRVAEATKAASEYSTKVKVEVDRAKNSLKSDSINNAVRSTRDDLQMSLLRAQIASKLWWLRVQGKIEEHAVYEAKATKFLDEKKYEAKAKYENKPQEPKDGKRSWSRARRSSKAAGGCRGKWSMAG